MVAAPLPAYPALWLNEVQPFNVSGATDAPVDSIRQRNSCMRFITTTFTFQMKPQGSDQVGDGLDKATDSSSGSRTGLIP